jgi:aspartyl/asparaginyl beta-hydroxylase (cupin superfamily)
MFLFYVLIILSIIFIFYMFNKSVPKNELFYDVNDVFPELEKIHKLRPHIMNEVNNVIKLQSQWNDWPEKDLYDGKGTWKIFPLYAFGIWVDENCKVMPKLAKFIKSIPKLKLATLSKLSPGMKLIPHQGWGKHSNNVLRAHYGLIVPEKQCYIKVSDETREKIKFHKNDEWMVFDDSKTHMAENMSSIDRIVLILDIERPEYIEKGKSKIGDSKELIEIVNYFKNKNIKIEQELDFK